MKISYYEAFDLIADEAVELLIEHTSNDNIAQSFTVDTTINEVIKKIPKVRKKRKSKTTWTVRFLVAILVIFALSSTVLAIRQRLLVKDGGIELLTDSNSNLIGKEMKGRSEIMDSDGNPIEESEDANDELYNWKTSSVITSIQKGAHIPRIMSEFTVVNKKDSFLTPEIIFTNDAMVILKKEDGDGWYMKKGEELEFKTELYPSEINSGKGQSIVYQYIFISKHVKSPTQMERDAVCRGQYHGWLKEKVGSHIVRRCHIHHCEQTGIVGRMGCVFSLIEDNHIHHINNMQQLGGAEIAGIKFHAAIDVIFRRNHIHHSTMGIWCDWQAQGTRITQNLLHDNQAPEETPMALGSMMSQDLFIEVSHGPTLIDNNILLSKASLRIAAQGVACVHNLILGAFTAVGGGTDMVINGVNQPRYTPYHIAHRTEVAGFMTILHGDNRVYNNIFIQNWPVKEVEVKEDMGFMMADNQEVGTGIFDDYPTYEEWISWFEMEKPADMMKLQEYHFAHLPVWVDGNAYFNGAKACNNEKSYFADDKNSVFVELVETEGHYALKTNVYDLLGEFKDGIINSDMLGRAFEPEERFENPDGSSIIFDSDYLGGHRGVAAIPGPFASAETADKRIW